MTLKKLLLVIAGGVGILGAFLPWYRASLFGFSATSNAFQLGALYAILAIVSLLGAAAIILLNVMKEKQIKNIIKIKSLDKLPLYIGIGMVAVAVIAFIAIQSESQGFGNVSFGVWMIGLAGVATIILPLLKNIEPLEKVIIGDKKSTTKEAPAKKETSKDSKKSAK